MSLNLRTVILAVPPVLPQIRSELHLNFAQAGAVTSLPVLCLSLAAIPGALLSSRFGARRVVGFALLVLASGAALRILPWQPAALFAATALLSVATAASQPAMAAVLRAWFSNNVERASAVTGNALNMGGLVGAVLTVGMLGVGLRWQVTFIFWAIPVFLAAVLWFRLAPGKSDAHVATPSHLGPLARDWEVWRAAVLFGCQSVAYFTASTWIPFLVEGRSSGYLAFVLGIYSVATVAPSLFLPLVRVSYATSRVFFGAGGILMVGGGLGLAAAPVEVAWLSAAILGFGSSMVFLGAIAAPALLAARDAEVAGYSALMLTGGYLISFVGPVLGGFLVDHTGNLRAPYWAVLASGLVVVVLGVTRPRARGLV